VEIFLNFGMFWIILLKTHRLWMLDAERPLALPPGCSGPRYLLPLVSL